LVSEAVTFYADGNIADFKTYVKAILTEVSFIFLSGYMASDLKQKLWVNTLRASVFSLMLFVISSQTILGGVKVDTNAQAIQEQIQVLEEQIEAKEEMIKFYIAKGWGNNARKQSDEKNELVKKLLELKEKQAEGSNKEVSQLVVYKSYGQAFFRVLLLLISVLITRRLFVF
jgi:predicted phage tail protein